MVHIFSESICSGNWANVRNRYLGMKFLISRNYHFGWARLSVACSGDGISPTLTGYAYETIPNKSIIAGKTKGKDVIVYKPATLGHLARGASAISAGREKEAK
jgi:hypothetical protein